jgi:hypothetical protein
VKDQDEAMKWGVDVRRRDRGVEQVKQELVDGRTDLLFSGGDVFSGDVCIGYHTRRC